MSLQRGNGTSSNITDPYAPYHESYAPWSGETADQTYAQLPGSTVTPQPTSYTIHPYSLHPTPYNLHPAPYTLQPTPYNLHPTPYILHPKPCTLLYTPHSTPCTPHSTPLSLYTPSLHPKPSPEARAGSHTVGTEVTRS